MTKVFLFLIIKSTRRKIHHVTLPCPGATSGVESEHERPQLVGAGGSRDHDVAPLGQDHDAENAAGLGVLGSEHLLPHNVHPVLPVLFYLILEKKEGALFIQEVYQFMYDVFHYRLRVLKKRLYKLYKT